MFQLMAVKAFFGGIWNFLKAIPREVWYGIIALLGAYFIHQHGYNEGLQVSKDTIAKYESIREAAKEQLDSKQVVSDTKIVYEYKDKIKYIEVNKGKANEVIEKVLPPSNHYLSNGYIRLYNDTVNGASISDTTPYSDGTASKIDTNTFLKYDISNLSICLKNEATVVAFQKWVRDTQANVEATNAALKKTK